MAERPTKGHIWLDSQEPCWHHLWDHLLLNHSFSFSSVHCCPKGLRSYLWAWRRVEVSWGPSLRCWGVYKGKGCPQRKTNHTDTSSIFLPLRHLKHLFSFTMWKAALLTLGLLVAMVDRVQSSDSHPSFYGVKLCGREFIRAVIFTCGGSRWRRSIGDSGKSVCVCVWERETILQRNFVTLFLELKCNKYQCPCSFFISSYWRRGLWPMEPKFHPSTYQQAGSYRLPAGMEWSDIECGICCCWIQPLSSLADLRGGAGGFTGCR